MEVVPSIQGPPPTPHAKGHQIMQVGNVLQVVPSPKPIQGPPQGYGASQTQPLSENSKPSVVLPQNNLPSKDNNNTANSMNFKHFREITQLVFQIQMP